MDSRAFKAIGWFVLFIFAVLVALRLDARFFPVNGQTAVHNPPPIPPSAAMLLTITIEDKGQGAQATDLTASRLRGDLVRWDNHTSKSFQIEFKDDPGTHDDDLCPFENGCIVITVPPNGQTGYFKVADRAVEHGKSIRFRYRSTTSPLTGPPDEPGMTVEG